MSLRQREKIQEVLRAINANGITDRMMHIGIISDTHGFLSKSAVDALKGVDHIVHAGDVGGPEILQALNLIAPVTAVRGNTDGGSWAKQLPPTDMISIEDVTLYVLHDLHTIDIDPETAGITVVISGHTHQPEIKNTNSILYLNPGSASQARNGGPKSIGRIKILNKTIQPEIVVLDQ